MGPLTLLRRSGCTCKGIGWLPIEPRCRHFPSPHPSPPRQASLASASLCAAMHAAGVLDQLAALQRLAQPGTLDGFAERLFLRIRWEWGCAG